MPLAVTDKKEPCGPGGKPGHATGEDTGFPHKHVSIRRGRDRSKNQAVLVLSSTASAAHQGLGDFMLFYLTQGHIHILELLWAYFFPTLPFTNSQPTSFYFTLFKPHSLVIDSSTSSTNVLIVASSSAVYLLSGFFATYFYGQEAGKPSPIFSLHGCHLPTGKISSFF